MNATELFNKVVEGEFPIVLNVDENGKPYGHKLINGIPRINVIPYTYSIAKGDVEGHTPFVKVGYAPSCVANANTDVWSYSATQATYIYPAAEMGMEVVSSDNTQDIATTIHSGTSTGGSTTSLIATGEDFLTTTDIGDIVILDKAGTTPEYGYVTAIVSDTELTIAGGFSHGGTGSGRDYIILDKSDKSGALAVKITYLDGDYVEKNEIVLLNGATVVATVNTDIFRVNAFRVVAVGSDGVAKGNIALRNLADTPVYSYITAGFTRARNAIYTVPAGKTLFVTNIDFGYGTTGKSTLEYARVTTRANIDPTTKFKTDGLFFPFTDVLCHNATVPIKLDMPTKLPEKTDIKISYIGSDVGVCTSVMRGWLEVE